jgi:hypothetical protein
VAEGRRAPQASCCHRVVSRCHLSSHSKIGKNGLSSQFQGEK